ncbi:MAG: hypothetical protein FWC41_05895 [Firmicutes bacterium]|nr:hypothetical protein [Bacillota bacterium]
MAKTNHITTILLNLTQQKEEVTDLYITISNDVLPLTVEGFPIYFKNKQKLTEIVNLIRTLDYEFSPIKTFKFESAKNGNNFITVNETRPIIIKKLIDLFTKENIEFDTMNRGFNENGIYCKTQGITIEQVEMDDKRYYKKDKKYYEEKYGLKN